MRYAIYRCLYGQDFIQESIKSIADYVDKIFIFWTDKPWGCVTSCTYRGEEIVFPEKFDDILLRIEELQNSKITLIKAYTDTPVNQLTVFINDILLPNYTRPATIVIPEVDHVFKKEHAEKAFELFAASNEVYAHTRQIELWKTPLFRVPERPGRTGTVFWDLSAISQLPETASQGAPRYAEPVVVDTFVHNFGFAASSEVMRWKHLTALAFSRAIQDSIPRENWFEDVWGAWTPDNQLKNLEPSEGAAADIPHVIPYTAEQLPEVIRSKYNI